MGWDVMMIRMDTIQWEWEWSCNIIRWELGWVAVYIQERGNALEFEELWVGDSSG
jgi:hypothetical protein